MSTALRLGPRFSLPLEAVTETLGILAVRRAGKSNAAVVMAEAMYDAGLPWVAIDPKGDWWGIRAAGDGKTVGLSVLVFGGEHGDVPLEPSSGKLVANLVVDQRLTCVLDVSEMTKADQRRFLTDFASELYRKNREPLHVFCEEADEYIPQRVMGETAKMVGAFETLVKRGGFRGIGITLITQRSASLNKDVLTQIGTLICLRTTSPQDRKAILGWLEVHAEGKEYVNELPGLANGAAVLFSPSFLGTLEHVKFRQRRTFDSGATPGIGKKVRPPARLADVDLDAIKVAMADTIEKQKASDPKVLQSQIATLKHTIQQHKDLLKQWEEHKCSIIEKTTEIPVSVLTDADKKTLQEINSILADVLIKVSVAPPLPSQPRMRDVKTARIASTAPPAPGPRMRDVFKPSPATREAVAGSGEIKIGKTEKAILSVLAQHGERTHRQLALQTGYSPKASTIGVSLGKLRKMGLVEPNAPIRATQAGIEALGEYEPLPQGPELLRWWQAKLGKTENAILGHLLDCYPTPTNLPETAEATGYSPQASTIGVALGKLRRLEIVDGWKVSDDFMRGIQ